MVEAGNLWFNVMVGKLWIFWYIPGRTWSMWTNYQPPKIRCNGMKMLIVAEFVDWVRGQTQFKTNLTLKIVVQDNQERVRIHLLTDRWIYTCFFLYILIASFGCLPWPSFRLIYACLFIIHRFKSIYFYIQHINHLCVCIYSPLCVCLDVCTYTIIIYI